ncbi:MAG TPA: transposase family protein, partial [Dehalococcoidia bacterium]|nr:transposase family protein [Dehalococcoidia bacterium]
MSGKGDCLDNAVVERFFSTLKTESEADNWKFMPAGSVKSDVVDF